MYQLGSGFLRYRAFGRGFALGLGLYLVGLPVFGKEIEGQWSRIGDAVHLEFSGLNEWNYQISKEGEAGRRLVIRLPKLSPETISRFEQWTDPFIKFVQVNGSEVDQQNSLIIELAGPKIDHFDYITDQPSRLVVDFYENPKIGLDKIEKKPVAKSSALEPSSQQKANPELAKALPSKLPKKSVEPVAPSREPSATEMLTDLPKVPETNEPVKEEEHQSEFTVDGEKRDFGIFDGADRNFARFMIKDYEMNEISVIASQRNIYIHFPMLRREWDQLRSFMEEEVAYEIKPGDDEENRQARLLLTLYNNKRYAVFLKTLSFFQKTFPKTRYEEIIGFLTADVYYKLWLQDKNPLDFRSAVTRYYMMATKFPSSVLAERTLLFLGYSYYNRGDSLGAIKAFRRFNRAYPTSERLPQVQAAIADSYLSLSKFEDALLEIDKLDRSAPDQTWKAEAAYRVGDVYFKEGKYRESIDAYKAALKKYPNAWTHFPNLFFNMAEAYFWISDYKNAVTAHRQFLERFPSHSFGGYSMTRLGELFAIFGLPRERSMAAYLESQFRYGGSSSKVARLRLLSMRMKEMKELELNGAIGEIKKIASESKISRINDFATLLVADGLTDRREFPRAIDELVHFYQEHPTSANLSVFRSRIVQNITEFMRAQLAAKDFVSVLRWHGKYKESWLKNANRIDTQYLLGLAYEQAGVFDQAAKIYQDNLNRLYAIRGTQAEKERIAFETLPSSESLQLRLAIVAFNAGKNEAVFEYIKDSHGGSNLNDQERVERSVLLSKVAEMNHQTDEAIRYLNDLVSSWKGQPRLVADPYLRLARLYLEKKQIAKAQGALDHIENLDSDTGAVDPRIAIEALELKGDVAILTKKPEVATETLNRILERFASDKAAPRIRYKLGKIFFDQGEFKAAQDAWGPLENDPLGKTWALMVKDNLNEAKWKSEYKQYMKRIPAAEDKGK